MDFKIKKVKKNKNYQPAINTDFANLEEAVEKYEDEVREKYDFGMMAFRIYTYDDKVLPIARIRQIRQLRFHVNIDDTSQDDLIEDTINYLVSLTEKHITNPPAKKIEINLLDGSIAGWRKSLIKTYTFRK